MIPEGAQLPEGACAPDGVFVNLIQVQRMVELFYSEEPDDIELAKSLCAGCPVREECLAAGMSERYGVWGGTTPEERRALRRRKQ